TIGAPVPAIVAISLPKEASVASDPIPTNVRSRARKSFLCIVIRFGAEYAVPRVPEALGAAPERPPSLHARRPAEAPQAPFLPVWRGVPKRRSPPAPGRRSAGS